MVGEKSQGEAAAEDGPGTLGALPGQRRRGRVLCVGGAVVDTTYMAARPILRGTSNPATGSRGFGGVARNVAANLARLGVEVALLSVVGDDENGRALVRDLEGLGIGTAWVKVEAGPRTAEYMAVLEPDRSLALGVADMGIFELLSAGLMPESAPSFEPDWIFADCNCAAELIESLLEREARGAARLAVDTVSAAKAERLPERLDALDLLLLNLDEAAALLQKPDRDLAPDDALEHLLGRGVAEVVLTLGAEGLLVGDAAGRRSRIGAVRTAVADVTGAGDALVATTLAYRIAGLPLPEAARLGTYAASLTLQTVGSTHPDLSLNIIEALARQVSAGESATPK